MATPLSSPLSPLPLRPLNPNSVHGRLSLVKRSALVGSGGGLGLVFRDPLLWRVRASGPSKMTEIAGAPDAFGSRNGGGGDEEGGLGEVDAILGSRSSVFQLDLASIELESTLNRLSKWVVAALFGIVILWKHDAEAMWAAMGSVINACLSMTLKQILNHQRPVPTLRSDPGMPSSHAQSMFYAASFVVLSLIHWLGFNVFTVTVGAFTLTCSSYLSWLRVSQKLHSVSQVAVGAALGSTFSMAWFWLWHTFVLKAFISSIWVRIVVVLGSAIFCVAFLVYVIRHWLVDEE